MIIETRYRDIPYSEVLKCIPNSDGSAEDWDRTCRGKPVRIQVPAFGAPSPLSHFVCSGPLYYVHPVTSALAGVCPHIAEIGD